MSKWILRLIPVLLLVLIAGYWFINHSGWFLWSHQPLQYMPNMHRTGALKPQRAYDFFADKNGARSVPAGALAREQTPYPFKGANFRAEDVDRFKNPLPINRENVLRGKFIYENNCIVCHGGSGDGNGTVVGPFPNPPSLNSEKVRNFADSQIFHVVTNGQNTMGSYAPQLREQDRWAAIHYVRVLQLASQPSEDDVRAFEEILKEARP